MLLVENDNAFFRRNPRRQIRLRLPHKGEMNREFMSLGIHSESQRRMLVWKVPGSIRAPYSEWAGRLMKIPYIMQPNEELEDSDKILMPLLDELMDEASKDYGLSGKA